MITTMEVFTAGISTPPLDIVDQDASLDMIQVKKIDGLGPVVATVNTTQYGSIDGEFYNGSYTPKRNIVITAALNPDWDSQTFESLRQILYTYFMPENQVRLRFTSTHISPVEITGYVESCEPDMFSKDPEYQISIICPQPYFVAVNPTIVQGKTQGFTTPTDVILSYEGNAETGFVVDVTLPSGGSAFNGEVRLVSNSPITKLAYITPVAVSTSTYYRWSSVQGDKYSRQYPLPNGLPTNYLGRVAPGSSWLTLKKGDNKIQVLSATSGLDWTITYYAKYGGL